MDITLTKRMIDNYVIQETRRCVLMHLLDIDTDEAREACKIYTYMIIEKIGLR